MQSDSFISIAGKTLLWRVGYFTRGNEATDRELVAGFHLLILLLVEKPISKYFLKKKKKL